MKEAAGEANMTVITIVLIGVVAAVGAVLIPRLMKTSDRKSCCQELGGVVSGQMCSGVSKSGSFYVQKNDGTSHTELKKLDGQCN